MASIRIERLKQVVEGGILLNRKGPAKARAEHVEIALGQQADGYDRIGTAAILPDAPVIAATPGQEREARARPPILSVPAGRKGAGRSFFRARMVRTPIMTV